MESKSCILTKAGDKGTRSSSSLDCKHKAEAASNSSLNDAKENDDVTRIAEEKPSRSRTSSGTKMPSHHSFTDDNNLYFNCEPRIDKVRKDAKIGSLTQEEEEDLETEAEFLALMNRPNTGSTMISTDPEARHIAEGLKINYMNIRNGENGRVLWETRNFGDITVEREIAENIPKEVLKCPIVCRELNFSSRESLENFRIEQRIFFRGHCIEEWFFTFGFVIPGSTNSWDQVIEAAEPNAMYTAEELSGKVTIETSFIDNKTVLCKNLVRIFYV